MNTSVLRPCREAARLHSAATPPPFIRGAAAPFIRGAAALVIALALGALAPRAGAAPAAFAYQGVIREADGSVPGNKNQTIQFRLYTQAEGGTPVWGRTVAVLLDADGLFNTELSDSAGSAIPDVTGTGLASILSDKAKQTLYIGLTVGETSGEIVPRQTILPVPYAMVAADIASASGDLDVAGQLSASSVETSGTLDAASLSVSGNASVSGNVAVNGAVSGYGTAPVGCIILWSGAANNIPEGWALCNGQNGTPDLRNRFVVGAGGEYAVGATGGEKTHTLTESEMPRHRHEWVGDDQLAGIEPGASEAIRMTSTRYDASSSLGSSWYSQVYATSYAGGNAAHENRPPYYALCYIMRVR